MQQTLTLGESAAALSVKKFLENRFERYSEDRNDPNKNALSNPDFCHLV
jgi:deoxyribodipyrimidine photolyase